MKLLVRAFALGLLACSSTFFIIWNSENTPHVQSMEKTIESLNQQGYIIMEQTTYEQKLAQQHRPPKELEQSKDDKVSKEEKSSNNQNQEKVVIKIEPGMSSSAIASILEKENMIMDQINFQQYLDEADYSRYLQVGTFELNNEMSYKEIAKEITSK
ncbi:YceG-like family protein [Thalassobacillus cyri]|uniref:YceG-like family protein n=1 Tax=Thalassobacillus cyri TaxID=571932 RepID=A0A1H4FIY9_9BACI|nr:endolytic transglycosylase MltG [Thalassobacillus cyri]SEA97319.1 YceG-like family protein [Thalassobacillus cyri]